MPNHYRSLVAAAVLASLPLLAACRPADSAQAAEAAQGPQPAHGTGAAQSANAPSLLNDLGPENGALARQVGRWDVTETLWDTPTAPPRVATGLIAERRMVGSALEETLRSAADTATILRTDYLTFNRVEGRWEYVSLDTRAAVGMMTAQSYDRGDRGRIAVTFQPFSVPGPGPAVGGQMLRMRQDIITPSADRNVKDQYFTMADGTGTAWLAHRYAYARRA